jgi:two-component system cell cycle sensor histidine kinase PleC
MSLSLVSGMARDSRIALLVDIPSDYREISGDFLKLKQLLLNILSNAIKFTPPDGLVKVKIGFTGTQAVVTVSDTGCGIAAADLERVTQPFVQVGNALSRKYGGSGLGLSIAKELCNLHGGHLTIHSVAGEGTTVRILLPLDGDPVGALPIRRVRAPKMVSRAPPVARPPWRRNLAARTPRARSNRT